MNKFLKLASLALTLFSPVFALGENCDTIRATDFGVFPDSFENCIENIQKAIEKCKENPGSILLFELGRYDIWTEGAVKKELYISNTSSETECPSKVKTFGIYLSKLNNVVIEGAGATFMMHGSITPIAVDSCDGLTLKNLSVDFERPAASEFTYRKVEPGLVILEAHRDTRYKIIDGKILLFGEGWLSKKIHCIKHTPGNNHFTYSSDWQTLSKSKATEIAPGLIAFRVPDGFMPEVGSILTLRDIIRSQVGTIINDSRDIVLQDVNMRFMHGLGIVSQYSKNITMTRVNCKPDAGSGRILASSADFMHFSGCSGAVKVEDCTFSGSQDDAINVHGTNLRIVEVMGQKTVNLRFMHHQTYGLNAFHPGDTIAFVNPSTMLRTSYAVVDKVERTDPRHIVVSIDRKLPEGIEINKTCVENITCTPTVHISGYSFTRHSTRGILVTTPRKVVIERNIFNHLGMAAILIEGDAEGWCESGPVQVVTIRDNVFYDCGYNGATYGASIALNPSNRVISPDKPVHENVLITGNRFNTFDRPVLYAKSTGKLFFTDNIVEGDNPPEFILLGCSDVIFAAESNGKT